MFKHTKASVFSAAFCFFFGSSSPHFYLMEAPTEIFYVSYEEISKDVLKSTIGVLTLNSGVKGGTTLRIYEPQGSNFVYTKTLNLKAETIPVSNFGYASDSSKEEISNFRYPILQRNGELLQIVIDPVTNSKAWIVLDEAAKDYYPEVALVDSLKLHSLYIVDIFHFAKNGVREFYMNPSQDSIIATLHAGEIKYSHNKLLEQNKDYLKVWSYNMDFKGKEHELTGWIKVRDNQGRLSIWLKYADTK